MVSNDRFIFCSPPNASTLRTSTPKGIFLQPGPQGPWPEADQHRLLARPVPVREVPAPDGDDEAALRPAGQDRLAAAAYEGGGRA